MVIDGDGDQTFMSLGPEDVGGGVDRGLGSVARRRDPPTFRRPTQRGEVPGAPGEGCAEVLEHSAKKTGKRRIFRVSTTHVVSFRL